MVFVWDTAGAAAGAGGSERAVYEGDQTERHLDRLDYQRGRFGFDVQEVGLDTGCNTPDIRHGLVNRGIAGVAGYRSPGGLKDRFRKSRFASDHESDRCRCSESDHPPRLGE